MSNKSEDIKCRFSCDGDSEYFYYSGDVPLALIPFVDENIKIYHPDEQRFIEAIVIERTPHYREGICYYNIIFIRI